MTTDKIHEKIQNIDNWGDIPAILEHMNNKIAQLESELETTNGKLSELFKRLGIIVIDAPIKDSLRERFMRGEIS